MTACLLLLLFFLLSFVHLSTHKEGDTSDSKWVNSDSNTIFMKNAFYKMAFAR